MSATAEEVLVVLKSIDTSLLKLMAHFGIGTAPARQAAASVPSIAPDSDLDNPNGYGDPEVKAKSPRDWQGDSQQGKRFSQCPVEYLDLVASRLDYFAGMEEDMKKKRYNELDASRARGWAARLRAGWTPPVSDGLGDPLTADSIPFAWLIGVIVPAITAAHIFGGLV